ncbi:MAG: hypothetical protein V1708_02230 [Candidatus Micrarchaeota archaeon]
MGGKAVLVISVLAFVLALAGSVRASDSKQALPCWDNVCPGTGMFFGCCDSNANGKYEQSECASEAAWKYQTRELTLEQACALQKPVETSRAEFTLKLKSGWNLVSVPVANYQQVVCVKAPCYQPMLSNLKSNTCPRDGIKIFAYDRVSKTYKEQTASLDVFMAPYGGFEAGKSYWVKTASDCEMAFDGTHRMFGSVDPLIISSLPPAASIASGSGWALSAGWNNVGAPIDNTEFKKVSAACTLKPLWRYNTAARKWEKAEVLKPGEGYFVKAAGDCGLGINLLPTATPTPIPTLTTEVNASTSRQLTFAKGAIFNLFDFANVNGKRLAIYWKRAYDGSNFGDGAIESLDVDSGQVTTLTLHNGMVQSNGKYLTYTEGNCVRYRDLATNAEGTAECGGDGTDFRDLQSFVPVAAGDSIYYVDKTGQKLYQKAEYNQKLPFNESISFPVYAYDVKTGVKREAFRVNSEFNAVSDGKTIAWTDYSFARAVGGWVGIDYLRPGATGTASTYVARGETGPMQVYHFDPATNAITVTHTGEALNNWPNYLSVSGKNVAYAAGWAPGNANDLDYNSVYVFNVESKKAVALTAADANHQNTDSDGNWLVWHAGGSAENDQIWLYDYSTGVKRQLTSGAGLHSVPHVLGNAVVYSGGSSGSYNLFLVDIK